MLLRATQCEHEGGLAGLEVDSERKGSEVSVDDGEHNLGDLDDSVVVVNDGTENHVISIRSVTEQRSFGCVIGVMLEQGT